MNRDFNKMSDLEKQLFIENGRLKNQLAYGDERCEISTDGMILISEKTFLMMDSQLTKYKYDRPNN